MFRRWSIYIIFTCLWQWEAGVQERNLLQSLVGKKGFEPSTACVTAERYGDITFIGSDRGMFEFDSTLWV